MYMSSIYNYLINSILIDIIPETKKSIKKGNKIFGAAIINKNNFETICIGTNNEIENPLWHGEISVIKKFYDKSFNNKFSTSDCIFLSTHEPCSLCLSAITWAGFDNFYFFFPYNETKNSFKIPHDLNILNQVFNINYGKYNKKNSYWKSHSILDEIEKINIKNKEELIIKIEKIKEEYKKMSNIYQKQKKISSIPLK